MTCIVWIIANNKVYIWWDTLWADRDFNKTIRKDVKVFKNWEFIIWFSGSYRTGQILRYNLDLTLDENERKKIDKDFMSYMCNDFISAVRWLLKKHLYDDVSNKSHVSEVLFLVWYKDRLAAVFGDFQIAEPTFLFESVGCWEPYAKWILYEKMKTWKLKWKDSEIEKQIKETIKWVMEFSAWVWGDVTVLHT